MYIRSYLGYGSRTTKCAFHVDNHRTPPTLAKRVQQKSARMSPSGVWWADWLYKFDAILLVCRGEAQVHRSVSTLQATKKVQENLQCVAPTSSTTNALRIIAASMRRHHWPAPLLKRVCPIQAPEWGERRERAWPMSGCAALPAGRGTHRAGRGMYPGASLSRPPDARRTAAAPPHPLDLEPGLGIATL